LPGKITIKESKDKDHADKNPLSGTNYLMENEREALRLDVKTDPEHVRAQALWAGVKAGMRVADIGCGIGKTTFTLNELVQPGGEAMGLDFSNSRISLAREKYPSPTISYEVRDVRGDLRALGKFDFIWVRFLLEYFRRESFDIVKNLTGILKKGGILCLIDLDCNCMNFHGASPKLELTLARVMEALQEHGNFDPFVGRKLYSYLYDLKYRNIRVDVSSHHVIHGELRDADALNWLTKVETVASKGYVDFSEFGGVRGFYKEFKKFLDAPRRFIYSPLVMCRGVKKL
jgi:ubiquinone/menaquinone biosynthesis C-methylase UbiE